MRIRFYFFAVFFFYILNFANSQSKDGTEFILNADTYYLKDIQANSFYRSEKFPLKEIIVFDYRFDTTKIGYIGKAYAKYPYSKIRASSDWDHILNNYFKNNFDSSSNSTLILAIKSFWIQEGTTDELINKKVVQKNAYGKTDFGGTCYAAIDLYIKSDSITPLFRLDDSFINFNKFTTKKLGNFFFLPFDSIGEKIIATDIPSLLNKRKKSTINEMDSFYKKRIKLPAEIPGKNPKGIFLTFKDFINNSPLHVDFKTKQARLTDELYIINNKQEELLTDFWGFNDGSNLFIKSGFSIYRAIKQGNSFEVFGGKHISNYHNNSSPTDLLKINLMGIDNKILHLNMDTGKFY